MDKFHNFYTEEEAEFVKRNYTKFTTKQIARKINKTVDSVKKYKYRMGYKSNEMATKSRLSTKKRRAAAIKVSKNALIKKDRELMSLPSIEYEQSVLMEMKALINLCELTDNKAIRSRAKVKLMQLSEIPKDNIYSLDKLWKLDLISDLGIALK